MLLTAFTSFLKAFIFHMLTENFEWLCSWSVLTSPFLSPNIVLLLYWVCESIWCLFHMPRWWAVCDSSSPLLCRCYGNMRYRATTKAFSLRGAVPSESLSFRYPVVLKGEEWGAGNSSPKQPKPVASVRCSSRQNHQVGKVLQIKITIFTSYSCIHSYQRVRDRHRQCKLCSVLKASCRKIVPPLPP